MFLSSVHVNYWTICIHYIKFINKDFKWIHYFIDVNFSNSFHAHNICCKLFSLNEQFLKFISKCAFIPSVILINYCFIFITLTSSQKFLFHLIQPMLLMFLYLVQFYNLLCVTHCDRIDLNLLFYLSFCINVLLVFIFLGIFIFLFYYGYDDLWLFISFLWWLYTLCWFKFLFKNHVCINNLYCYCCCCKNEL